jgi:predicted AAA+ superfamily ATPase
VQKVPKLLDAVHKLIESTKLRFVLTGSSSRKLKRAGANLLAGRAFRHMLFPFTFIELGNRFDLQHQLNWGSLPEVINLRDPKNKTLYLKAYYENYLKEEIVAEQAVRNLNPFRLFLPVCLQNEGEPLNFTRLAEAAKVDVKTIQNYYEILTDTHLGFFLNSYDKSVRVVQRSAPKFYFFDTGVRRAIEKQLTIPVQKQTSIYGHLFESWFVNECYRLNEYYGLDYKFSYLRTKDGVEVDLIIERPDGSMALVEIKSTQKVEHRDLKHLLLLKNDFKNANLVCVCDEKILRKHEGVEITPWSKAFKVLKLS